jgi:hypothetical protein
VVRLAQRAVRANGPPVRFYVIAILSRRSLGSPRDNYKKAHENPQYQVIFSCDDCSTGDVLPTENGQKSGAQKLENWPATAVSGIPFSRLSATEILESTKTADLSWSPKR